MSLRDEIFEQPAVIARLLERGEHDVAEAAVRIRKREPRFVYIAARGSSDNAGLYAKYLWGGCNGLPVALATPSLFSVFKTPPRIRESLVVGISQSGRSPDIVSVVEEGRRQGALTLAITNDAASPLAASAEIVIDIEAGCEEAVAATKTYTAQLVAIAMLSVALADDGGRRQRLRQLPDLVRGALALDAAVERASARYRYMKECVVLGRGFNYATAHEWALKLKELAYVFAEPYSSADFQHGPVALAHQGFPVFAVVPGTAIDREIISLLERLVQDEQVELLTISGDASALALANTALELSQEIPEWLTPMVAIIPAQLFCYHLTRAKGYSTEGPRGLSKVTLTW